MFYHIKNERNQTVIIRSKSALFDIPEGTENYRTNGFAFLCVGVLIL